MNKQLTLTQRRIMDIIAVPAFIFLVWFGATFVAWSIDAASDYQIQKQCGFKIKIISFEEYIESQGEFFKHISLFKEKDDSHE